MLEWPEFKLIGLQDGYNEMGNKKKMLHLLFVGRLTKKFENYDAQVNSYT